MAHNIQIYALRLQHYGAMRLHQLYISPNFFGVNAIKYTKVFRILQFCNNLLK